MHVSAYRCWLARTPRLSKLRYSSSTIAMTMRVAFSVCSERQNVSRDWTESACQRAIGDYFAGSRTCAGLQ